MKLAFKTFGCRANSVDTDFLWSEALKKGFTVVPDTEFADGYVINSCTVTESADRDARNQVRRFKKQNPASLVAVIGCYGQVGKDALLGIDGIDFVLGTAEKFRVLELMRHAATETLAKDQVSPSSGFLPEVFLGSQRARASIKVQDGCNFNCSFCIIPQARGRSRSLPKTVILKQISDAYAQGYQEVVLTGIHLAHYGWDLNTDLETLLKEAFALDEGPRIRLSTLDPFEIPDSLIAHVGKEPRLCPHFHIALQSGSDRILKAMRRIYKASEFVEVTRKLVAQEPDVFIGVDMIVGFPGETDEDFEQTVKCLKDSPWTKLHVFPFSARRQTVAATLPDPVDPAVIADRALRLRDMSDTRYDAFLRSQLGKQKAVIWEKPREKEPGVWMGHTENYIPTRTRTLSAQAKQLAQCTLSQVEKGQVWAEVSGACALLG